MEEICQRRSSNNYDWQAVESRKVVLLMIWERIRNNRYNYPPSLSSRCLCCAPWIHAYQSTILNSKILFRDDLKGRESLTLHASNSSYPLHPSQVPELKVLCPLRPTPISHATLCSSITRCQVVFTFAVVEIRIRAGLSNRRLCCLLSRHTSSLLLTMSVLRTWIRLCRYARVDVSLDLWKYGRLRWMSLALNQQVLLCFSSLLAPEAYTAKSSVCIIGW